MADVERGHVQQAGQQRMPQHHPVADDRVGQGDVRPVIRRRLGRQQAPLALRRGQRIGHHLLQPGPVRRQQIAQALFQLQRRVASLWRQCVRNLAFGNALIAIDARDLLDHVRPPHHARANVQTMIRRRHTQTLDVSLNLDLQRLQHPPDLCRRQFQPQNALNFRLGQVHYHLRRRARIRIHQAGCDRAARPLPHGGNAAPHAALGHGRVHPARETVSCLRRQIL